MNHFQIITSGMKLREIRNKFKLKQQDLAGKEITRNLISLIENDKAALTKQTAELIANNINEVCKNRKINFTILPEDLIENIEDQLKNITSNFKRTILSKEKEIIKGTYDDDIIEIEDFLRKYDLKEEKFTIYRMLGNLYKKQRIYDKAYIYYIKAFENCNKAFKSSDISEVVMSLSYCHIKTEKYLEAINFNKLTFFLNEKFTERNKFIIKFNTALAYKKLDKYEECIDETKQIENTFSDILEGNLTDKFDIKLLQANCHKEMKHYNTATDEYMSILSFLGNKNLEYTLCIYANLINLYVILNDTGNIKLYIKKCLENFNEYSCVPEKKYSAEIYSLIAIGAQTIKNIGIAKEYFFKSIESARESKNYTTIEGSLIKLLDIFIASGDEASINKLKLEICELISLKILSHHSIIILKLINFYNLAGEREKISDFINFILNTEK